MSGITADTLAAPAREIVAVAARRLLELYGDRVQAIYLYGSYARGQQRGADSDIDLALILDAFESPFQEIERTGDVRAALALEYGIVVSIQHLTMKALAGDVSRLSRIIRREGIRVA